MMITWANPTGLNGLLKLGIRGAAKPGDCQHLAPWTQGTQMELNTITLHKQMDMNKNKEDYINPHMYISSVSITLRASLFPLHCATVTSCPQWDDRWVNGVSVNTVMCNLSLTPL